MVVWLPGMDSNHELVNIFQSPSREFPKVPYYKTQGDTLSSRGAWSTAVQDHTRRRRHPK
jgi:hypothetical protein